jgi:alkanesulfonate monooxygenase SsuD/methylene tetrahydromethanopterin reductase-like flavin-dependent oxidoreductase (luciferase family)
VNLSSIGVPVGWWLDTARLLESAGFAGVWCADHFISRGRRTDPVLECWTTLTATAAVTRSLRVGSWVTNVMNRHPSVLARMAATVQDLSGGRLELGIGIGGHPGEHQALGIPTPPVPERVARLEEAVKVLRLLWSGGPVSFEGSHYQLHDAHAYPVPLPAPRIIVGGETRGGARLAARAGDAWTTTEAGLERYRVAYEEALQEYGRARAQAPIVLGLERATGIPADRQPVFADLRGELQRWRARGADEIVLSWVRPHEIPALLVAAERARLA